MLAALVVEPPRPASDIHERDLILVAAFVPADRPPGWRVPLVGDAVTAGVVTRPAEREQVGEVVLPATPREA
jgi:hypothetical protein